jgi:hypothetical protein
MFLAIKYPDIQELLAELVIKIQKLQGAEASSCYYNLDYDYRPSSTDSCFAPQAY